MSLLPELNGTNRFIQAIDETIRLKHPIGAVDKISIPPPATSLKGHKPRMEVELILSDEKVMYNNIFKVQVGLTDCDAKDISINTWNHFLTIEAEMAERFDGKDFVVRKVTRRYPIPDDVDQDRMMSRLSSDGILTVFAPRKAFSGPTT